MDPTAATTTYGTYPVEELHVPWQHPWGLVVRYEEPADRPNVIDLVFASGNRTAETRGARYRWDGDCWDLADIPGNADEVEEATR